jgi:Tol biopolymer transport system component
MNKYLILILVISFHIELFSQELYLGQKAPGLTPEVFAPDMVSLPDRYEFGSVFSKNGDEFFYGITKEGKSEILSIRFENGNWSLPKTILSHKVYSFNDPMLSPDGNQLYFISDMAMDAKGEKKDIDIWFVERAEQNWSQPVNVGAPINSEKNEYYISFSNKGSLYFSSNINTEEGKNYNFDIYKSEENNGKFMPPIKLDSNINSLRYEADVFISPNEDYVIFCAIRKDGLGQGDLYISFKNGNSWTPALNMGNEINNKHHQLCPFVTADGKYFFYTSNEDIYWVDAQIIDSYRTDKGK